MFYMEMYNILYEILRIYVYILNNDSIIDKCEHFMEIYIEYI